jgi:hypothetical protein
VCDVDARSADRRVMVFGRDQPREPIVVEAGRRPSPTPAPIRNRASSGPSKRW